MNLTAIVGRSVLDLSAATTIGRVDDVVIDAPGRRVVGFLLGKVTPSWLPWESMTALGADAVTIDGMGVLAAAPDDVTGLQALKAIGGRVLTDGGRELGTLVDIDIDPSDGTITALTLSDRTIPAESLLGVGGYATVVADPPD